MASTRLVGFGVMSACLFVYLFMIYVIHLFERQTLAYKGICIQRDLLLKTVEEQVVVEVRVCH